MNNGTAILLSSTHEKHCSAEEEGVSHRPVWFSPENRSAIPIRFLSLLSLAEEPLSLAQGPFFRVTDDNSI